MVSPTHVDACGGTHGYICMVCLTYVDVYGASKGVSNLGLGWIHSKFGYEVCSMQGCQWSWVRPDLDLLELNLITLDSDCSTSPTGGTLAQLQVQRLLTRQVLILSSTLSDSCLYLANPSLPYITVTVALNPKHIQASC